MRKEVGPGFQYLMLYDGTYYKIGLIDATYGIINDGERMPLTIQNDLGICIIMPVFIHNGEPDENHIIIEVR